MVSLRGDLHGARMLDLYAGSGAVGLEAVSRGAACALLVEAEPSVARTLLQNVRELALPNVTVRLMRVEQLLADRATEPFDIVFADPPYAATPAQIASALERLTRHGWVAADGWVVVERASRDEGPRWPSGLSGHQSRRYGDTTFWYGHAALA